MGTPDQANASTRRPTTWAKDSTSTIAANTPRDRVQRGCAGEGSVTRHTTIPDNERGPPSVSNGRRLGQVSGQEVERRGLLLEEECLGVATTCDHDGLPLGQDLDELSNTRQEGVIQS